MDSPQETSALAGPKSGWPTGDKAFSVSNTTCGAHRSPLSPPASPPTSLTSHCTPGDASGPLPVQCPPPDALWPCRLLLNWFSSFRFQWRCHLLQEAFLDAPRLGESSSLWAHASLLVLWTTLHSFFFFFFFLFSQPCSIWKFPGQGLNPSHSCDLHCSCGNTDPPGINSVLLQQAEPLCERGWVRVLHACSCGNRDVHACV